MIRATTSAAPAVARSRRSGGRGRATTIAVLAAAMLGACTSSSSPAAEGGVAGTVTVSAASSLIGAFDLIGARFERAHPGVDVVFNYGPSSTLAAQITQGAPADVLATADEASMRSVLGAATARRAREFARNGMVIVTKPRNPTSVRRLADLERAAVVALCGEQVPCGKYAARVLRRAGVRLREDHVTRQIDATSTVGAVRTGDATAAIVYVTDASAAGDGVATVPIAPDDNVVASYPIAVLPEARNRTTATAFADFVTSTVGARILRRSGFRTP